MWERMCLNHSGSRDCTFSPFSLNTGVQPDVFSFARSGRDCFFSSSPPSSPPSLLFCPTALAWRSEDERPQTKSRNPEETCAARFTCFDRLPALPVISRFHRSILSPVTYFSLFFSLPPALGLFSLSASLCYTSSVVPDTPRHARSNCGRAIRPISPISCC